jgi:hypothetical protein
MDYMNLAPLDYGLQEFGPLGLWPRGLGPRRTLEFKFRNRALDFELDFRVFRVPDEISGLSGFSALDFKILTPSDFGLRKCRSPRGGGGGRLGSYIRNTKVPPFLRTIR